MCFSVLHLLCSQLIKLPVMHVLPTPLSIVSLLSLHFMNRTTFQLVLQLTELTWKVRSEQACANKPDNKL